MRGTSSKFLKGNCCNLRYLLLAFLFANLLLYFFIFQFWGENYQDQQHCQILAEAQANATEFEAKQLEEKLLSVTNVLDKLAQSEKQCQQQQNKNSLIQKWLTIGIPSVPRKDNIDYLNPALDSLASQMLSVGSAFDGLIRIVVMNMRPGSHPAFDTAKSKYSDPSHPASASFVFLERSPKSVDGDDDTGRDGGDANRPGYRVRQQTRDVGALLHTITREYSSSRFYLVAEDDFNFCPHFFQVSEYILSKSSIYAPNWIAIRVSFGLNGIFLHMKDVKELGNYLVQHQRRRPPDHLAVEWFGKETDQARSYIGSRVNLAYKYNILHHIGAYSTLRGGMSVSYPQCHEPLVEPVNFKVEAFSPTECPNDDIWPCNSAEANSYRKHDPSLVHWK